MAHQSRWRMLIDKSHSRWAVASLAIGMIAMGLYVWADRRLPDGMRGGTVAGLGFGVFAVALMIVAVLPSVLRKVPSWWWIGSRRAWLRGHIWLGALSGWMSLLHGGFHRGGTLEQALWVLLVLTLVTGAAGLVLQQFLPRFLTARVPYESPYEQIPHLCTGLRRRADTLIDEICRQIDTNPRATSAPEENDAAKEKLRRYYDDQVRPFLSQPYRRSSPRVGSMGTETIVATVRKLSRAEGVRAPAAELGEICEVRRQLGEQQRIHRWLHGWLLIHVPLSWALLVLVFFHAFWSLYY